MRICLRFGFRGVNYCLNQDAQDLRIHKIIEIKLTPKRRDMSESRITRITRIGKRLNLKDPQQIHTNNWRRDYAFRFINHRDKQLDQPDP